MPPLARRAQADHRDGAGRVRRGRADARLGVRPHRRHRRRLLPGPGQPHGDTGR